MFGRHNRDDFLADEQRASDRALLIQAIELSKLCPVSSTAFAVGAVIADQAGRVVGTGYSRELGEHWHAEEVAIEKAKAHVASLEGFTLYSSLEPCGRRKSKSLSCAALIASEGISRVFFAAREPSVFVEQPNGNYHLREHGVRVVELDEFAREVYAINANVFDRALL